MSFCTCCLSCSREFRLGSAKPLGDQWPVFATPGAILGVEALMGWAAMFSIADFLYSEAVLRARLLAAFLSLELPQHIVMSAM